MVRALAGKTEVLHAPIGGVRREHYELARRNVLQRYAMLATLPSAADEPRDVRARRAAFGGAPLHWARLELLEQRINHHATPSFGAFERRWFAARNAWDVRLYAEIRERMLSAASNGTTCACRSSSALAEDGSLHHSGPQSPPPPPDPPYPPASPPRPPNRPPTTTAPRAIANHTELKVATLGFKDGFKDGHRVRCPTHWRELVPACRGCKTKSRDATSPSQQRSRYSYSTLHG